MAANVKSIASRDNPLLVRLRKLAGEPAAYRKLGSLWIEGEHLCSALLQRGGAPPAMCDHRVCMGAALAARAGPERRRSGDPA